MEANSKKRSIIPVLIVYSILFYTVWALNELFGKPFVESICPNPVAAQFIKSIIVKTAVWAVPALLLIRRYDSEMRIHLKEMFTAKVEWLKWIPLYLFVTAYVLLVAYRTHGKIGISEEFGAEEILMFLDVGITEETVFRGWLLNATARGGKPWLAVLVNAVMFLAIHFPIWIAEGDFVQNITSGGFLFIMALSALFSYLFLKTRNLLVPITLHMYYDLLCWLFI